MNDSYLDILEETVADRRKKETFEQSLGRVVKNKEREFGDYIEIIGEVREKARNEDVDLKRAAEIILGKQSR